MKCLRIGLLFFTVFSYRQSLAQADFIPLGDKQYDVLNRLEIQLRKDSVLNFSAVKPFNRRRIMERMEYVQSLIQEGRLKISDVDAYNLNIAMKNNFEWRKDFGDSSLKFKYIFSKQIATHPPYFGIKQDNFSAYVTPLVSLQTGKDNNINKELFNYIRGFSVRGQLTKNLGYYTTFTSAREVVPLYVTQYIDSLRAFPNQGYFKKPTRNGYDYYDARGGIMLRASKNIDLQFAYDKVFIGNGFRSLILSDFSNSFLFLKANFHFWKLNYYTLLAQMVATHADISNDYEYPKKYDAFHMLEYNAKWFTLGFFENIMFDRSKGFELSYLNPFILYSSMQRNLGSPDKATVGFNLKANISSKTQLYGQFIINEFIFDDFIHPKQGSWENKQAYQLGWKQLNLFGVPNLDLQAEVNFIRPFVYTHNDSATSFTHYNQPLAHPLGANLREFISIIKYQPFNKLKFQLKSIYTEQGLDSAGLNMGGNIFELYTTRARSNYLFIGSGILAKTLILSGLVSYEIAPNIFIDLNAITRRFERADKPGSFTSNIFNVGIRVNLARREYDF